MGHTTRVARRAGAKSFGNTKKGMSKRKAGKRSGIRRKAKIALVVKKPWIDYLLNGSKTWEVRGSATKRRGWIHLAESGSGKLIGGALSSLLGLAKGRGGQHEFSGVKAFVGDAELAGLAAQCALLRDILGLFQNGVLLMDEVDLV